MAFWLLLGAITLCALILVLWPVLVAGRSRTAPVDDDPARRLAVYRDRRGEIERERDAGRIGDEEAQAAERELVDEVARQFVDAEPSTGSKPVTSAGRLATGLGLIVIVPALAWSIYLRVGMPAAGVRPPDAPPMTVAQRAAEIRRIQTELEQRVKVAPEDAEAWATLGELRRMQGDHRNAVVALEKALALMPAHAGLMTDLAESLAVSAGGNFAGRPTELLRKAIASTPDAPKTNGLLGAALYRAGKLAEARGYLAKLVALLGNDSPQAAQIAAVLARIDAQLGSATAGGGSAGASAPAPAPAPGAAAIASRARLSGSIDIDPALRQRLAAGATLFVYARAAQGPRMPLAALRLPLPTNWPFAFELGEAQSMNPQRPLSSAGKLVIEARISASGNAMRATGDLFGTSDAVELGASAVAIRIAKVVE
ncbi:MAG: c-type cytochrome biogenesis protein CcmI [Burkholderiaceae bacterium]|nr:c-type cytochrome biogenesis protein CcmI [Burkholderiaceae bacterium]